MRVALVCSHGGHLSEMEVLRSSLRSVKSFFITYDSVRTRTRGDAYLIRNIGSDPIRLIVAFCRIAIVLAREKPDAIISTGAEIAIPAFLIGKAMGLKLIFVESLASVSKPSGTGFLLNPLSDLFLVQWPQMKDRYGDRAEYVGAII